MDENRPPLARQGPMTKKELKALRKLEKLDNTRAESRQNTVKWIVLGVGSLLFIAFFGFLIFLTKQNQAKPVSLTNDGWVRGENSAKVTLVEFADFQCPACKAYHPIVSEVLASYKGKVKLLYKHFPLTSIHKNAFPAAQAAEAAGAQGKFFQMHDLLYEHQEEWAELAESDAKEKFIAFASDLKLDLDKFKADLDKKEFEDKIRQNQNEGVNSGVSGTPTFFVNGKRIENPRGLEEFKRAVENALK